MFQNILVALDGSKQALKAADVATDLAVKYDARVTFLTVTKRLQVGGAVKKYLEVENLLGEPQYVIDEMTEEIIAEAKKAAAGKGLATLKTEVREGNPARSIVEYAKADKSDLIVLGSRGLGDIEGGLLGSVSHKVASLAPCTVITVK